MHDKTQSWCCLGVGTARATSCLGVGCKRIHSCLGVLSPPPPADFSWQGHSSKTMSELQYGAIQLEHFVPHQIGSAFAFFVTLAFHWMAFPCIIRSSDVWCFDTMDRLVAVYMVFASPE